MIGSSISWDSMKYSTGSTVVSLMTDDVDSRSRAELLSFVRQREINARKIFEISAIRIHHQLHTS